jgi:glycerol-3-phosphate dehydrogenase
LARTATLDFGAVVANHVAVVELLTDPAGRVGGAVVEEVEGRRIEVTADAVVNAAGIWTDEVLGLDGVTASRTTRPARGVHIAVPWSKLRNDVAVIVPGPGDARPVFVIPWLRHGDGTFAVSYIGTTDTDYDGDLNRPPCTSADIEYLLGAVNRWVRTPLEPVDVVGTWSGLRPLVDGAPDDVGPLAAPPRGGRAERRRERDRWEAHDLSPDG